MGDVIEVQVLRGVEYTQSTVVNITDEVITLFRPYVHTSDYTYTGGLMRYLGFEEYTIWPTTQVTIIAESRVTEVINRETDPGRLLRSGVTQRRREGTDHPDYRKYWQGVPA
jgi:hypothetical protein